MMLAVWIVGLLLLVLWSGLVWSVHLLWSWLMAVPWADAMQRLREWPVPAPLEPWFGTWWTQWLQEAAPLLQWMGEMLQGSARWVVDAMPILLWATWALGALLLLAVMGAVGAGVWWMRRRQAASAVVA